jgi:hypothetical protein
MSCMLIVRLIIICLKGLGDEGRDGILQARDEYGTPRERRDGGLERRCG